MYGDRVRFRSNPLFFNGDVYLLGIGIGDSKACGSVTGNGISVVGNVVLFDGVDVLCAVSVVLVQAREAVSPAVGI